MSSCPNCGETNSDNARFCQSCATPLQPSLDEPEIRKVVTVLFADVVGSTALGSSLDTESLTRVMSRYYKVIREGIERHGGRVEKFIGDAVLGVFGIPRVHEDDALRAARAVDDIGPALDDLNEELRARWGVTLQVRMGLNTGEVLAGGIRERGTIALGDVMNVAARLQQAAAPGDVLVSASTERLVRGFAHTEPVGPLDLKGKSKLVRAYRLLGGDRHATDSNQPEPAMVGRQSEKHLLLSAFDRAIDERRCTVVTLVGDAGVGKSRLVRDFALDLGERARVFRGRCLSYGQGVTFWAIAEIVREAAAVNATDSLMEARAKLRTVLDEAPNAEAVVGRLELLLGWSDEGEVAGETAWAIRSLFEALARQSQCVIVLDDVQWAEPVLLDLLEEIAERLDQSAVLLLCMARPELLDSRPDWATRFAFVRLRPLRADDSRTLIERILGSRLEPFALERILDAARGNPLYLQQFLRMLEEDGRLERRNGWTEVSGELSEIRTPPSVQALLLARLDRLAAEDRTILQRASVVGEFFSPADLRALCQELEQEVFDVQLRHLASQELIIPERSVSGDAAFRFPHLLFRDAAYQTLPKETRADLHERFAAWVEESNVAGEFEAIIGHHLKRAHEELMELGFQADRTAELRVRAAHYLGESGRRSLRRDDAGAAVELLRNAVALAGNDPGGPEFRMHLGLALFDQGNPHEAEAVLAEAVGQARAVGDRPTEIMASLELVGVRYARDPAGTTTEAVRGAVEGAIPALEQLGEGRALATAWRLLADLHDTFGRNALMREAAERALEYADQVGETREVATCLNYIGLDVMYGSMAVEDGIRMQGRLLERFGREPTLRAVVLRPLAYCRAMADDLDGARSLIATCRSIAEDLGPVWRRAAMLWTAGLIEAIAGDPTLAHDALAEARRLYSEIGDLDVLGTLSPHLAEALYRLERYEEAWPLLKPIGATGSVDDVVSEIARRQVRAKLLARRHQVREAERIGREAVALSEQSDGLNQRANACLDLAEVLVIAGRHGEAIPLIDKAISVFRRKGNRASVRHAQEILTRANLWSTSGQGADTT